MSSKIKKFIILDKSFIRSSNSSNYKMLEKDYRFLLTEEFLYETFKDFPKKRADTFKKFGSKISYRISKPIAQIISDEAKNLRPTTPSENLPIKYMASHLDYQNPFFSLSQQQLNALNSTKNYVNDVFKIFLNQILKPKFNNKKDNRLLNEHELKDYINLMIRNGDITHYKTELTDLDSSWFIFRFFQILHFYAYDLVNRYQKLDHIIENTKTQEKIKHDILDFFYLIQGLQEGGLATCENKIKEIWEKYATEGSVLIFMKNKEISITVKS